MSSLGLLGAYGGSDDDDDDDNNNASSGSGDSETDAPSPKKEPVQKTKTKISLPSANAMFSATATPSFLDKKKAEPIIIPVKKKQDTPVLEEKGEKKRVREDEPPPVPKLPTPSAAVTKKPKKNAKDRVKGQRLKGQAGIGSDFRHWKSDAEMVMRQQFD